MTPNESRGRSLQGRVALITGGAAGIGRAIASRLADDGARVAIADINLEAATSAAEQIGRGALMYQLDVADPIQFGQTVDDLVGQAGRLDILINNAGIAGRSAPTWELSSQEWRQVIEINLSGVFYGCQAALPHMRQQGYGRIVNIASIAGKEGNPNAVPYSASKAGVIGLTKAVAKEVVKAGILVNCITPAVIETEILRQVTEEHVAYMLAKIPLGRVGQPHEVAALAAWLASDECSFSTGAVFDISGGRATY
jgi:3-oxoacyl-[acyl-carrier protein] reductase